MDAATKTDKAAPSSLDGLTAAEAQARLAQYGANAIAEKKTSLLARFAGYFWGPIPWMIEVAAVLSAAVGHWEDFGVIVLMLLINAGVGFFEEKNADDAIAALKQQLAPGARVKRDGKWIDLSGARTGARRCHSRSSSAISCRPTPTPPRATTPASTSRR